MPCLRKWGGHRLVAEWPLLAPTGGPLITMLVNRHREAYRGRLDGVAALVAQNPEQHRRVRSEVAPAEDRRLRGEDGIARAHSG
jgi:hypothetical protein